MSFDFKEWIDRMLHRQPTRDSERESITHAEQQIVTRLARLSGKTPSEVRAEARRAEMTMRQAVRTRR